MSLREFPPGQDISKKSRWRHLRYVPLVILAVLALVAAVVGFVVSRADIPEPAAVESTPSAARLPAVCQPPADVGTGDAWLGANAASSEEVVSEHSDELTNPYVVGDDGFVDWGDSNADNFSQAIGRRTLTADELNAWHVYLADLDSRLAEQGIPLYIVIAPMKWAVYPDELPQWAQAIRGPGPLDQLLAAGSDLPLVDLRAPLQQAATEEPTYSAVNSHWSDYGAYVGWNALVDCMTASDPGLTGLSPLPSTGVTLSDEFNEFAPYGIPSPGADWAIPELAEPLLPVELTLAGEKPQVVDGANRTDMLQLPATTVTTGAQSDQSVLFVRDSFGGSMSVYLQQAFASSLQVRHNFDGAPGTQPDIVTLATTYKPDVVILEVAQRHLIYPPTP